MYLCYMDESGTFRIPGNTSHFVLAGISVPIWHWNDCDRELTGMVQIADLCSYALRRYLENNETEVFDKVFQRADRRAGLTVGVRHFTDRSCACKICREHRQ